MPTAVIVPQYGGLYTAENASFAVANSGSATRTDIRTATYTGYGSDPDSGLWTAQQFFLWFDLSGIPAGSTITSATFAFTNYGPSSGFLVQSTPVFQARLYSGKPTVIVLSATKSGNVVTVTTDSPHRYSVGDQFLYSGEYIYGSRAANNGTYTVASVESATSLTFTSTTFVAGVTSPGPVTIDQMQWLSSSAMGALTLAASRPTSTMSNFTRYSLSNTGTVLVDEITSKAGSYFGLAFTHSAYAPTLGSESQNTIGIPSPGYTTPAERPALTVTYTEPSVPKISIRGYGSTNTGNGWDSNFSGLLSVGAPTFNVAPQNGDLVVIVGVQSHDETGDNGTSGVSLFLGGVYYAPGYPSGARADVGPALTRVADFYGDPATGETYTGGIRMTVWSVKWVTGSSYFFMGDAGANACSFEFFALTGADSVTPTTFTTSPGVGYTTSSTPTTLGNFTAGSVSSASIPSVTVAQSGDMVMALSAATSGTFGSSGTWTKPIATDPQVAFGGSGQSVLQMQYKTPNAGVLSSDSIGLTSGKNVLTTALTIIQAVAGGPPSALVSNAAVTRASRW
jgi:hypothetical protein